MIWFALFIKSLMYFKKCIFNVDQLQVNVLILPKNFLLFSFFPRDSPDENISIMFLIYYQQFLYRVRHACNEAVKELCRSPGWVY